MLLVSTLFISVNSKPIYMIQSNQSTTQKSILNLLKLIFGILFIIAGLRTISNSFMGGLLVLIAGIIIIPKISEIIQERVTIWQRRPFRIIFTITVLIIGMIITGGTANKSNKEIRNDINVIKKKKQNIDVEQTVNNKKFIQGIKPVDVYGNFENKGYKIDKQISTDGSFFICSSAENGIDYEVKTYCEDNVEDVTSGRLTATRTSPQFNEVLDMKPFLKYGCSLPYDGSNGEKINAFIETNYFKNKASIVISGVKFTIFSPTEYVRMIDIEGE